MSKSRVFRTIGVCAGAFLFASALAHGAGFALIEQGVKGLGEAYSGASTSHEDASSIFFNPAGMALLGRPELDVGMHVIMPQVEFKDGGTWYPELGLPVHGGDGGDAGEIALIPNIYYSHPVNDRLAAGIGLNAPFGLATEYEDGWVGRYHGLRSDLKVININPSFGVRLLDWLSVGGGVNVQYLKAELTSAVDLGGILASQGAAVLPGMLDGKAEVEGDAWGLGYNLGVLVQPLAGTTLGLAYRSQVSHKLEGDATFKMPPQAAALQAMGMFVDTDAKADVTLPETVSFGLAQELGYGFTLKADALWTRWSRFDELRIRYSSNQRDSVTPENWENAMRYALGLSYAHDAKWTFRAGTAYDETPIKNSRYRTPRIPDADRVWLSAGASYQATEHLGFDAGYTRLIFKNSELDNTGATGDRLVGSFEGHANLVSLQACYIF